MSRSHAQRCVGAKPTAGAAFRDDGGAARFRSAAHSILSHPGNRQHMARQDSQNKLKSGSKSGDRKKRLILAGRTYTIDEDDISVIAPDNEKTQSLDSDKTANSTTAVKARDNDGCNTIDAQTHKEASVWGPEMHPDSDSKVARDELRSLSFVKQRLSDFSKRESSMSLCSSTSIESDWSDEELEEVDRMVHEMQQKIYLPDSDNEEEKESNEHSLENSHSSSSTLDDSVSIDELKNMILSSSSLSSHTSRGETDISWKRLKRTK
jgi:hypothetical protein